MEPVKEKEFFVLLGYESRIRHYHVRIKQQVIEFVVQLEVNLRGKWKPVVRYDTAHGFAHRDIYSPDGRSEKVPLSVGDYSSALTFAELDIRANWELYRERFLKEDIPDD